jgi:pyrimidine operon attenuation protein/uracil phosphoribosyltransferase
MDINIKAKLIDEEGFNRTITRLAHEILEKNKGSRNVVLIGMRTRGENIAERIKQKIKEIDKSEPLYGVLDVTLYRDDFRTRLKQPEISVTNITINLNDRDIILIDDVLYTGRTVRAALDALMDLGRPSTIQLCVMVDRGHREMPIRADFVGKNIPTSIDEEVQVRIKEIDGEDAVYLLNAPDKK